jgi:HAD superfamily hydrolase (TIGR01509 family)
MTRQHTMGQTMFNWNNIDTVLVDMDGTLLDLKFDNQFWTHHLPKEIARQQNIPLEEAKREMISQCDAVKGTLDWYCLDYWSRQTQLDIRKLKVDNAESIVMRSDVIPFLQALKQRNIQRVLLTDAHPDSLTLKIEQTGLNQYLDHIYSTHEFGHCKESPQLWQALLAHHPFDPQRTLFIDDNEELLLTARKFGIRYVLGIKNPDSELEHKNFSHCPAIHDYKVLTQELIEAIEAP